MSEPNLRVLRRSRPTLTRGDVFAMLPPDGRYLFGRVIGANLDRGRAPMPGANLIYVYGFRSGTKLPTLDALRPTDLLIPPSFVNRMPWTRGYLENVAHWPMREGETLPVHCFYSAVRRKYVDIHSNDLPGPTQPCGDWGLKSYLALDDEISDALGIPRAGL